VRAQLLSSLRRLGLPADSCAGDTEALRRAAVRGMFTNAACFDRVEYNPLSSVSDPGVRLFRLVRPLPRDHTGVRLRVHNSSVLFRSCPPCVVFTSVQQTDDGWFEMQNVTAVAPEWLIHAAPHMYERR
jgi:ATP-dependent RNA helicase DDX35